MTAAILSAQGVLDTLCTLVFTGAGLTGLAVILQSLAAACRALKG